MAQITLKREQVQELHDFCVKHGRDTWFLAKDQGAYIGASATDSQGKLHQCLFYFKGCDPKKDEDWWDVCYDKFGGDDFGENLPVTMLKELLEEPITKMTVKLTATRITVHSA